MLVAASAMLLLATAACDRNQGGFKPMPPRPQSAALQPLPQKIRVVALGDSLAYGAGDETGKGISGRLRDVLRSDGVGTVHTVNLGINGAQTSDLEARLRQERVRREIADADAIVLSIGANDLFRSPRAARASRLARFARVLSCRFSVVPSYLGERGQLTADNRERAPQARWFFRR